MKIKELSQNIDIDFLRARILSKQGPRRVRTREGLSYVTDILIADDTGTTIFNIFGTQKANALKIGQVIEIKNGSCNMFNFQKQVSLGQSGRVNIVPDDPDLPRTIPH